MKDAIQFGAKKVQIFRLWALDKKSISSMIYVLETLHIDF